MRFSVTYDVVGSPELPLDYRGGFVALIKSALEKSKYKEQSYYENPESVPLCFAIRLDRKPQIKDGRIFIGKNIRVYISSPSLTLGTAIYNGLVSMRDFVIYKMKVSNPSALYIKEYTVQGNNVTFATLSPIIVRHHQHKDRYILPNEDGFMESLLNALSEEWLLYNDISLNEYSDVEIDLLKFKKVVMTHYGGLILGFTGVLRMTSNPSVLKFFYQSGIGYRRNSGFGFVGVDS